MQQNRGERRGDAWATYASYGKSTSTPRIEYVGILAIDGNATSLGGAMRAWIPRHARVSQGGPLLDSTVWLKSSLYGSSSVRVTNVCPQKAQAPTRITSHHSSHGQPSHVSSVTSTGSISVLQSWKLPAWRAGPFSTTWAAPATSHAVLQWSATAKFSQSIYSLISEI